MFTRKIGPKEWSYKNELSSEEEVRDFMYGLVRLLKPDIVVETGCYMGEMARTIGEALRANKHGHLHTCDIEYDHIAETIELCSDMPVSVHHMDSIYMLHGYAHVDLAYIDGSEGRVDEANAVNAAPGAYIVLHDANQPHYYDSLAAKWNNLRFPTPLGLAVFEVKS